MDKYSEAGLMNLMAALFFFLFLRNLHTVFHSGCTNLHSYQQQTRVRFCPHPCQICLSISGVLTGVKVHPPVLTCISLIIKDVKHLFKYPLTLSYGFFRKHVFWLSAHFYHKQKFLNEYTNSFYKDTSYNRFRGPDSTVGEGKGTPLQYSCLENP